MKASRDHWAMKLRTWYAECITLARKLRPTFEPMPFEAIRWQVTGRASRKAGICWPAQKRIWLHAAMTEQQARDTFAHEVAHLWVAWYNEAQPNFFHKHDQHWRYWARMLGDDGERCHDYAEVLATRRGDWAHCLGCRRERKQVWLHNNCRIYRCRRCKQYLIPGRLTQVEVMATIMRPTSVKVASEVASDKTESVSVRVRSLALELGILREGGLASSPEAKKIRVMLRKLDPEWRTHA